MIEDLAPYFSGVLAAVISFFAARKSAKIEIDRIREENRAEYMAVEAAKHFLAHEGYTDRSFDTLKKHLGGFEDDELRRILVSAGAIRTYRKDGTEWWRLLDRMDEYIENKKAKAE